MSLPLLALLVIIPSALAHGGEVITPDNTTDVLPTSDMSSMMMMTPYFHWLADADALFFRSWVPHSPSALAGACIALVTLAIFERFLANAKGLVEAWWRRRHVAEITRNLVTPDNASTHSNSKSIESGSGAAYLMGAVAPPLIPPFELVHDLSRGAMQGVQSLIGFFLMLSVMTYNAAFLIAVVVGLAVGEVAFARLGRSGAHPGCVAARSH